MAFTIEQYNAISDAYALGATTVTYGDKTVAYRSLDDMNRIIAKIEAELSIKVAPARRRYAQHSKGLYPTDL